MLPKAATKILIITCVIIFAMFFSSEGFLFAQETEAERKARDLIEEAYAICSRGIDSLSPEEAADAIALYEEAQALLPDSLYLTDLSRLSRLYYSIGNRDKAIEFCDQLLNENPYDLMTIAICVDSFIEYEMLDEAERWAYRAVAISYDSFMSTDYFGDLIVTSGFFLKLEKIYRLQGKEEMASWAESREKTLVEESERLEEEFFISLNRPEPYYYVIVISGFFILVVLIGLYLYYRRKRRGKGVKLKRDLLVVCLLTLPISVIFGILYPIADVVSIPAGIALFLIPEIGVVIIVLLFHYRMRISFEGRIITKKTG